MRWLRVQLAEKHHGKLLWSACLTVRAVRWDDYKHSLPSKYNGNLLSWACLSGRAVRWDDYEQSLLKKPNGKLLWSACFTGRSLRWDDYEHSLLKKQNGKLLWSACSTSVAVRWNDYEHSLLRKHNGKLLWSAAWTGRALRWDDCQHSLLKKLWSQNLISVNHRILMERCPSLPGPWRMAVNEDCGRDLFERNNTYAGALLFRHRTEPILHAITTISIAQSACKYSVIKSLSTSNIFKLQTGW
jgi:hypothetical protein